MSLTKRQREVFWEVITEPVKVDWINQKLDDYPVTKTELKPYMELFKRGIFVERENHLYLTNNKKVLSYLISKDKVLRIETAESLLDKADNGDYILRSKDNGFYEVNRLHYIGSSYLNAISNSDVEGNKTRFITIYLYGRPIAILEYRKYPDKDIIVTVTVLEEFRYMGLSNYLIVKSKKHLTNNVIYATKFSSKGKEANLSNKISKVYGKRYKGEYIP